MERHSQTQTTDPRLANSMDDIRKRLFMDIMMPMTDVRKYLHTLSEQPNKARLFNKVLFKTLEIDRQKLEQDDDIDKLALARQRVSDWTLNHGAPSLEYVSLLCRYWNIPLTELYRDPIQRSDILTILNQHVVGQEHYKEALAITVCSYFRNLRKNSHDDSADVIDSVEAYDDMPDPMSPDDEMGFSKDSFRNTLLVWGPSGSGKTYGVSVLCRQLGLPVLTIHCNSLVKEGIVGFTLGDYFTSAYQKYGKGIRNLVVIFDEFDKIFSNRTYGIEISNELLHITDNNGTIRVRTSPSRDSESITVPTDNMMFVFCGCFPALVGRPGGKARIGFSHVPAESGTRAFRDVNAEDFMQLGISNELLGRIQNITYVEELNSAEIIRLLDSASSPFLKYKEVFDEYGYEAELTADGKEALASIVISRRLGVRGLEMVLKQTLGDTMFVYPSHPGEKIKIDAEYIISHQFNN